MPLILSVLRCPDQSVPEQRRVAGGEYALGRGTECDWVLRDPDRVLSKRHCTVEFFSGGWQVRDVSTNGTFVNGASEPVGRDQVRMLRDGDRIRLGAYEIECRVEEEAFHGTGRWQAANALPDPMTAEPSRNPFAPPPVSDIFSVPLPGLSPAGGPPQGNAPLLPADFDPFAPEDPGPVMPDHRPSTNDVFTPPRAMMPDLLPQDWNAPQPGKPAASDPFAHLPDPFADAPPPMARPADPFAAPAAKLPDPFADLGMPAPPAPVAKLPDPFADLGMPAPAAPVAKLPDPFADLGMPAPAAPVAKLPDPFADLGMPAPVAPVAKLPDPFADLGMPAPVAPVAKLPDPFADLGMPPPVAPVAKLPDPFADLGAAPPPLASLSPAPAREPPTLPATPAPATGVVAPDPFAEPNYPSARPPSLAPAPAAPPPPVGAAPADGLLAALALIHEAAGLAPPAPGTDAAAALTAVGAGMHAAVAGLRGLLIARADVKREFRIEQTMLRAAGNNPVKFAATDEAAVLALLGPKGNGPAALRETVNDLTAHQVATVAATQAAAKALLARLSPMGLEGEIPSGGIMPGAREKKLWEAYRKLHQQVTDQFEDDFDSAFGKAFARAYEEAARGGR